MFLVRENNAQTDERTFADFREACTWAWMLSDERSGLWHVLDAQKDYNRAAWIVSDYNLRDISIAPAYKPLYNECFRKAQETTHQRHDPELRATALHAHSHKAELNAAAGNDKTTSAVSSETPQRGHKPPGHRLTLIKRDP